LPAKRSLSTPVAATMATAVGLGLAYLSIGLFEVNTDVPPPAPKAADASTAAAPVALDPVDDGSPRALGASGKAQAPFQRPQQEVRGPDEQLEHPLTREDSLPPQLRGVQDDALPYADVRGVSKVFRDHAIDIRNCMDREGPEAYAGEQTVAIQLTLHLNGEEAYVASVDALGEHQSRYAAFGGCVTELLSATRLQGQASPEKKVNWTVRR